MHFYISMHDKGKLWRDEMLKNHFLIKLLYIYNLDLALSKILEIQQKWTPMESYHSQPKYKIYIQNFEKLI